MVILQFEIVCFLCGLLKVTYKISYNRSVCDNLSFLNDFVAFKGALFYIFGLNALLKLEITVCFL